MRSKYETHVFPYLEKIKLWVAKGATCQEIADKLHISRESLNQYKKNYPDVYDALMAPRGDVDDSVECALYKRCLGYDYEEVTKWQTIGRGGELIWLEKRTTKHLPPDPASVQFWLANRRKAEWRRTPESESEATGESGVVMLPEVKDE